MEEKIPQNQIQNGVKNIDSSGEVVSSHVIPKLPAIRTYENDLAEATQQKKISRASIVIAESEERHKEAAKQTVQSIHSAPSVQSVRSAMMETGSNTTQKKPQEQPISPKLPIPRTSKKTSNKNSLKFIFGLLLVCAGLALAYYIYTLKPWVTTFTPSQTITPTVTASSIVPPDIQKIVDITGQNGSGILSTISQTSNSIFQSNPNKFIMAELVFTETQNGVTTRVTGPQFISKMGITPPDSFTTSINDNWMFGMDNSQDEASSEPFVVFTTGFFQNTFAGMLAWEQAMPEDLNSLFRLSTSTINIAGAFKDRILDNKNIREFVSPSGSPLFLYGFIDNQTLVISKNEATFTDILNRIEKQTYLR